MSSYVFDIDGVIMDTHAVVKAAYQRVGVEMPDDAWGKPWRAWLPTHVFETRGIVKDIEEIHRAKNMAYNEMIYQGRGRLLPAAKLAMLLVMRGYNVRFATGASLVAARAVLSRAGLWHTSALIAVSATPSEKAAALLNHAPSGVYVDDDPEATAFIADVSGWCGVVYEGQAYEDLGWEVAKCMV